MNKLYTYAALFLLVLVAACKKDSVRYNLSDGSFGSGALKASSSNVVLSQATENDTAVRFSWSAATFGDKPVVSYTLQIDKVSDTSGANGWSQAKSFTVGSTSTAYGFMTKDLNNTLNAMGLPSGVSSNIAVRVRADVPQADGTASSVKGVYSNVIVIKITTYNIVLYIPGAYQGWDPGTAPVLNPVEGRPGLYEAFIYTPGAGTQYFKYTNARDWNHTNYGDGGNGTFSIDGAAGGLSVPNGGYYEVTADFNTNKWTAVATTWSIIGDATPGGWSNDTQMSYDPASQTWKVTCDMLANGSFKFRANNAWSIDFGVNGAGKLVYADNPFFGYTAGLNNLTVPQSGNYTITLDLHNSQNYTYTLVRH